MCWPGQIERPVSPPPPARTTAREPAVPGATGRLVRQAAGGFHCWATGATGTAIDLIALIQGTDIPTAISALASRIGTTLETPITRRVAAPAAAPVGQPDPAIEDYVTMGERWLWTPTGRGPLQYLTEQRCLNPDILRTNRVGFDPGTRLAPRTLGLPHGPGIILPTFNQHRLLTYVQTRSLRPNASSKYINPIGQLAANPGLSWPVPVEVTHGGDLVICEGLIDALTAAGAGYRAVAVLGAGHTGPPISATLATRPERLILAFDADPAGDQARIVLTTRLEATGRSVVAWRIPDGHDLNSWLQPPNSGHGAPPSTGPPVGTRHALSYTRSTQPADARAPGQ